MRSMFGLLVLVLLAPSLPSSKVSPLLAEWGVGVGVGPLAVPTVLLSAYSAKRELQQTEPSGSS